jgi:photosystem II stability/assembly factor-like uncharacterized protein
MKTRVLFASFVALLALALALPGCTSHTNQTATAPSTRSSTPSQSDEGQSPDESQGSDEGDQGEVEGDETGPEDGYVSERVTKGGIPAGALARAALQARAVAAQTLAEDPAAAKPKWKFIGPTNIGGRILDIAVDPNAGNTIYVGTASGGVWKSTDGGATVKQAWPISNPQPIGALAVASDGTLYAGTGEAGPGGGSITYGGSGIWKSTDGATTWKKTGKFTSPVVGRIVIDPTNPSRIFVAATGDLFNPGGGRGVYRSTDAGAHWKRVLQGDNGTTGAVDLAMDPSDPDRIYAAMWDHRREPDLRTYGGVGSGVYRSTDGGATWNRLANGLPAPSANIGRIGLAVSPSTPKRVYAIVISTNGSYQGFYRSNDSGDTWTQMAASGLSGSQSSYGWWFGRIWVDPADQDRVFVAGVPLELSTNGGQSFGGAGAVHADQHAMAWDPKQSGRVYLGNDGGLYHSDTNGSSWTHATSEPFTQFYSVDVSEQDDTRLVGGAQDNGTLRSWANWGDYTGGDGEEALIDPTNQNNIYGCSQYGACSRSTNGGNSSLSFGSTVSDRYNWFTPVQFDPSNPQVIYLGGNRLNRSTNGAASFSVISPDLTGGPGRDSQYPFGTITTVAASKTNAQELLVGTDDGRVWYTTNQGGSWTRSTDSDIPGFWVSRVAIDPSNAQVAYATFSGYRGGSQKAYVLKSTDGGATWSDISGNLPTAPVNDIVVSGGTLYVATDVGVYSTTDGGATWRTLGKGLPATPVDDLELSVSANELFAASFGRGMWKVALP